MNTTESSIPFDLSWMTQLVRKNGKNDSPGVVIPTVANALILIAHDQPLAGLMRYNKFTETSLIMRAPPIAGLGEPPLPGPYPRAWQHEDITAVLSYMQRLWNTEFSARTVESAMAHEAMTHPFHPVVQWLDGLQWDGKNRLFRWLITAFGAESSEYVKSVGAKTLIAAVRRVRHPGCKFDTMLILEGDQGIKKSTALQSMFSTAWFSDATVPDLGGKDAAMCLHGAWCLEFAEIAQLVRSEVETIKGFLSRAVDRYRPPYGKNTVEKPRQGILIGTTNEQGFLRDTSGNRRFWPVECVMADVAWIEANREQLWAEACYYEAQGETVWLDDVIIERAAIREQADRVATDPWDDPVAAFIQGRKATGARIAEIMETCLFIEKFRQDMRAYRRVASILRRLGWEKRRPASDGVRRESWFPKEM